MISKTQAQSINKALAEAIDKVCKKHGLKIRKQRLLYGETVDLKVSLEALDGKTKEQATYERWQRVLGLPQLGTKVRFRAKAGNVVCEQIGLTHGLLVGGPYKTVILKAGERLFKMPASEVLLKLREQA